MGSRPRSKAMARHKAHPILLSRVATVRHLVLRQASTPLKANMEHLRDNNTEHLQDRLQGNSMALLRVNNTALHQANSTALPHQVSMHLQSHQVPDTSPAKWLAT